MCRELRKKDVLQEVLRLSHDRSLNKYASIDEEDDFQVNFHSVTKNYTQYVFLTFGLVIVFDFCPFETVHK